MNDSAPISEPTANYCPACGTKVTAEPLNEAGDVPCPECGRLYWFVKQTLENTVVLTFLPGLMVSSESLGRVEEVLSAVDDSPRAILDLSQLHFLSSIFLGLLVAVHRQVVADGGKLRICGVQPDNLEVFRFTKLDKFFDICEDRPSALASF